MTIDNNKVFLIFDVESIGLYGEAFSVGGVLLNSNGVIIEEFEFETEYHLAKGSGKDREWVKNNVSFGTINCINPQTVVSSFWNYYKGLCMIYSKVFLIGECIYPVETNFLAKCLELEDENDRMMLSPYPVLDLSSMLFAVGINPMQNFKRKPDEIPEHRALNDARLTARLFVENFLIYLQK